MKVLRRIVKLHHGADPAASWRQVGGTPDARRLGAAAVEGNLRSRRSVTNTFTATTTRGDNDRVAGVPCGVGKMVVGFGVILLPGMESWGGEQNFATRG